MDYNVISVSLKPNAREFPTHPGIECIMQKQVGQQWTDYVPNAVANCLIVSQTIPRVFLRPQYGIPFTYRVTQSFQLQHIEIIPYTKLPSLLAKSRSDKRHAGKEVNNKVSL